MSDDRGQGAHEIGVPAPATPHPEWSGGPPAPPAPTARPAARPMVVDVATSAAVRVEPFLGIPAKVISAGMYRDVLMLASPLRYWGARRATPSPRTSGAPDVAQGWTP